MDDFGKFLRTMRVYLLGRGIISLGVILATFALPALGYGLTFAPALIIALGGATLNSLMRLREQRHYEESMVNLYREDIASHVGKAPDEVTRADLPQAAMHNDVIDQALKRERHKTIVGIATSALAGMTTFGLLYVGLAQNIVTEFFTDHFGQQAGNLLRYVSSGIVASISGLVVHDGLEAAIGVGAGLSKAAAHDRVLSIENKLARGQAISAEQVYAVVVASDPTLAQKIRDTFRQPYSRMNSREQTEVLIKFGVADDMNLLANSLNEGRIRPGHLAYITSHSGTPPARREQPERAGTASVVEHEYSAPEQAAHSFAERLKATRPRPEQSRTHADSKAQGFADRLRAEQQATMNAEPAR